MIIVTIPERMLRPGSYEAVLNGCSCPIVENCFGRGYMNNNMTFIINENCLIHANKKRKQEMTEERVFADDAPVSYAVSLDTTSWFDPSTMPNDGSNFIALFAEDENDYESAESVYKMTDGSLYYSVDDKVVDRQVIAWSPMPKINRHFSSCSSTG